MKTTVLILVLTSVIFSCKKSDLTNAHGGFTGALDSVIFYRSDDSINLYDRENILTYSYDASQRVSEINLGNNNYRNYYYQGNAQLPYKQVDSISSSILIYDYTLVAHNLTYDNLNRLKIDNITSYSRSGPNHDSSFTSAHDMLYKYEQNYMTYQNSNFSVCLNIDTAFYNNVADVKSIHNTCLDNYFQNVVAYSPYKNPLTDLNIYPLSETQGHILFWSAIQNLDFNIFQPKFMYAKLTGRNTIYYTHTPNDSLVVNFYTKVDLNNKITDLVIANYNYYLNFNGDPAFDKNISVYKFYYHP